MYTQPAKGDKPEQLFSFIVEFGLHCFTKGPNKHKGKVLADYPEELYYSDHRETRIFCFRRHRLSLQLPAIARNISQETCFHTGKGNFFVIEIVDEAGDSAEYEVYFKVSRASKKGYLRLFVESAYIRKQSHGTSQPTKKKIGFFVIAHNTRTGKAIKPPK